MTSPHDIYQVVEQLPGVREALVVGSRLEDVLSLGAVDDPASLEVFTQLSESRSSAR